MSNPDLRKRGSKGGGSVDMEAQEPLLPKCPTPVTHEISFSKLFERVEPLEADVSMESPVPRRLVVMFDGTSNLRNSLTNVSRLFEAIDDSRPKDYKLVNADDQTILNQINPVNTGSNGHKGGNGNKDGNTGQPVLCSTCQREREGPRKPPPPFISSMKGPDGNCPECKQPALKRSQLVHYVRGVGSKWYDAVGSLAFGTGLSNNVKNGYKWLVNHYRDGDEIFVFGFSRGAFSARSLVSLLHRCGGLPVPVDPQKESVVEYTTNDIVDDAYAMYQAFDPKDPLKPVYLKRGKALYDGLDGSGKRMQRVTVAMLGVWDTVGAVGLGSIPFLDILYYHFSSRHYEFHDQDLPCIVEHAYHALAIDEHRFHFAPTLWKVPRQSSDSKSKVDEVPRPSSDSKNKVDEVPSISNLESISNPDQMSLTSKSASKQIPLKEVKQVWFMGSHCNVGGGADLDDLIDPDDLWQYSYVWMQKHAEKLGLRFYWTYETPAKKTKTSSTKRYISHRHPEESYKNFVWPGLYQYIRLPFYRDVTASIDTGAAKLHWSVVERIKVDRVEQERIKLEAIEQERIKLEAIEQERIKVDGVEQERIKDEQEKIKLEAVKRKSESCLARLKATLCFWSKPKVKEKKKAKKFEPYRPESLFKERPTPTFRTPRRWIWFKLTPLLCTLGISKPVEDHGKLEVAKDGKITVSGKWKWPWVEFDDLKTVTDLKELEKKHAASTLPFAELKSCNCRGELKGFKEFKDERWLLRKAWDWWVNWWPL